MVASTDGSVTSAVIGVDSVVRLECTDIENTVASAEASSESSKGLAESRHSTLGSWRHKLLP